MPIYFAYGSNLHPTRLIERVGAVTILGTARLEGHTLSFDKRGGDGSGKCHLNPAPAGSFVLGALFELTTAQFRGLDQFEGRGFGYERESLRVEAAAGPIKVESYLAMPAHREAGLQPFDWYRALVWVGARLHRFDAAYCARIAATPSRPDADARRSARWLNFARDLAGAEGLPDDGAPNPIGRAGRID